MSIVCFLCAALSLGYFLLIVVYSGISTDFCGIWIAITMIFLTMGAFLILDRKNREGMPKRLPIFIYTTFCLWLAVGAFILIQIGRYAMEPSTEGCDYVIVIGERVYENGISSTLKKRLDRTAQYSKENPGTVFILSGGTDGADALPEALAMYNYLILEGLSEEKMLIETDSSTTEENVRNSLRVIDRDLKIRMVPPPIMIGVLTSDYHVFRMMKTAGAVYEDRVYPIAASSDPILFIHQCIRECAAVIHDRMNGTF